MYKFFLIVLSSILFTTVESRAQTVKYTYDLAGNRIRREIVFPRYKTNDSTHYTDQIADHVIKIFPNPTEGLLQIEVNNIQPDFNATAALFSSNGMLVSEKKNITSSISFNISEQPAGIYFLRFRTGEETKTWRIIKK